jgi:predicted SprT family Zn-dependent metalloprotease
MKKVFLEGKPTSTVASEDLIERFKQMMEKIGPYPHSKIILTDADKKKQTTRMKKCMCRDCEYVVRTVQKWLDLRGAPICPCNKLPMQTDAVATEPDEE